MRMQAVQKEDIVQKPVAPHKWNEFLVAYAAVHKDWIVHLDELNSQEESSPEELSCVFGHLKDIWFENEELKVYVSIVPEPGGDRQLFEIGQPHTISINTTRSGADVGLQVDHGDSRITRVRFRVPAMPELVDGFS